VTNNNITTANINPALIHDDKASFNGDILIMVRDVFDTLFDSFIVGSNRVIPTVIHPCDILFLDTVVCCESVVAICNNNRPIGTIFDWEGCCELCVIQKKDLISMMNKLGCNITSSNDILDTYYGLMDNDNISREDINPNGEFSVMFEIPNFKGTITHGIMKGPDPYNPDDDILCATIIGTDTKTNQPINMTIQTYFGDGIKDDYDM
jgi:hypothetical protein